MGIKMEKEKMASQLKFFECSTQFLLFQVKGNARGYERAIAPESFISGLSWRVYSQDTIVLFRDE